MFETIPLLRPKLPTLPEMSPYLGRIVFEQWGSNNGPLVRELEMRLSEMHGAHAVTVASATLGLEIALLLQTKTGFVLPAYSFRATWTAMHRSVFNVQYDDVDSRTWSMPLRACGCPPGLPALYVAPFGAPFLKARSDDVIDAAAAFGNQPAMDCPVVFSLHATKCLPAGEGGFVLTKDEKFAQEIRQLANFGFGRASWLGATNAKMSEYHAAVALASLDTWPQRQARYRELRNLYVEHLEGVTWQLRFQEDWVSPYMPVKVPCDARAYVEPMAKRGVEVRAGWYEARKGFPVAEELERRVLCLPMHLHLSDSDVVRVCEILAEEVKQNA